MSTFGSSIWTITDEDRRSHNSTFYNLGPSNGSITGDQARGFFMKTGLPIAVLGHIWNLCDVDKDGRLTADEFSIGMHLINLKLKGTDLPASLPPPMIPASSASKGLRPITSSQRLQYNQRFNKYDSLHSGYISGAQSRIILSESTLSNDKLAKIWSLADHDKDGSLNRHEFALAMHLVTAAKSGLTMPEKLPSFLDPSKETEAEKSKTEKLKTSKEVVDEDRMGNYRQGQQELIRRRKMLEDAEAKLYKEQREKREKEEERLRDLRQRKAREDEERQRLEIQRAHRKAVEEREGQMRLQQQIQQQRLLEEEEKRQDFILRQSVLGERQEVRKGVDGIAMRHAQLTGNVEGLETRRENLENSLIDAHQQREKLDLDSLASLQDYEEKSIVVKALEGEYKDLQEHLTGLTHTRMQQNQQLMELQSESGSAQIQQQKEVLRNTGQQILDSITELNGAVEKSREDITNKKRQLAEYQSAVDNLQQALKREKDRGSMIQTEKLSVSSQKKTVEDAVRLKKVQLQQEAQARKQVEIQEREQQIQEQRRKAKEESEKLEIELKNRQQQAPPAIAAAQNAFPASDPFASSASDPFTASLDPFASSDPFAASDPFNASALSDPFAANNTKDVGVTSEVKSTETRRNRRQKRRSQVVTEDIASGLENAFSTSNPSLDTDNPFANDEDLTTTATFDEDKAFSDFTTTETNPDFDPFSTSEPTDFNPFADSEQPSNDADHDGLEHLAYPELHVALYEFEGEKESDLSFKVDDIISVVVKTNDGWWEGELNGRKGWFPSNYVDSVHQDLDEVNDPSLPPVPSVDSLAFCDVPSLSDIPAPGLEENPFAVDEVPTFPEEIENNDSFVLPDAPSVEELSETQNNWDSSQPAYVEDVSINTVEPIKEPVILSEPSGEEPSVIESEVQESAFAVSTDGEYYTALYAYDGQETDLSFKENDKILVKEKVDDGWWFGECEGRSGWFPSNYVNDVASVTDVSEDTSFKRRKSSHGLLATPASEWVTALHTYSAQRDDELEFNEGDVFVLVQRDSEGWWEGTHNGKTGWFPENYVEVNGKAQSMPTQVSEAPITAVVDSNPFGSASVAELPKQTNEKPAIARALENYEAQDDTQLSLKKGGLVSVTQMGDEFEGWWEGSVSKRGEAQKFGWFPADCVQLMSRGSDKKATAASTPKKEQVVAIYDFNPTNDDELTFSEGDRITILDKSDPDWWDGEFNGRTGLFPSSYVE